MGILNYFYNRNVCNINRQNWNESCNDVRSMCHSIFDRKIDSSKILELESGETGQFSVYEVSLQTNDVIETETELDSVARRKLEFGETVNPIFRVETSDRNANIGHLRSKQFCFQFRIFDSDVIDDF